MFCQFRPNEFKFTILFGRCLDFELQLKIKNRITQKAATSEKIVVSTSRYQALIAQDSKYNPSKAYTTGAAPEFFMNFQNGAFRKRAGTFHLSRDSQHQIAKTFFSLQPTLLSTIANGCAYVPEKFQTNQAADFRQAVTQS